MKCNGFDSDNYRYFNLNKSGGFSGYTNFSYGELKDNDIIKLSNKDLVNLLFSNNYFSLKDDIYILIILKNILAMNHLIYLNILECKML